LMTNGALFDGGTFGTIQITGTGTRTIDLTAAGHLPNVIVNAANVTIQGPASGVTTLDKNFTLSSGTFTGLAGNLDVNGDLSLLGGTFTAPSGSLYVAGVFTASSSVTWSDNNGAVVFDGGSATLIIDNSIAFHDFTVSKTSGGLVIANNQSVVVAGNLSLLNGILGNAIVQAQSTLTNAATYNGGNTVIQIVGNATRTINLSAGAINSLVINAPNVTVNGPSSGTLTVTGNLSIISGQMIGSGGNLIVDGDVSVSGGTFTAPSANLTFSGSFLHTAGTFNHNSGTVILNGTNQMIIGNNTFYNFTKIVTLADTLYFDSGKTQIIEGALTLRGETGQTLSLVSNFGTPQWEIDAQGARDIAYVNVMHSKNNNATAITAGTGSVNLGGNTNWTF
ncbi:hypothetical protein HY969_00475, partial [Candidatus Kaiserbacteria bacterium]|nr:hypothetical protein [Candidatus Kaiserbacteria bacterium]